MSSFRPAGKLEPPESCPVCGEDLARNARACPECGADYNSGWREDAEQIDAAGEDAEGFDYEEYTRREFGDGSPKPAGVKTIWWVTAIFLLAALGLGFWFSAR